MEKIILKDGEEIVITSGLGAALYNIKTVINDYSELETLVYKLRTDNLSLVKFQRDDQIIGVYTNLTTSSPLFQIVDGEKDDKIEVIFNFREMTEQEMQYAKLAEELTNTEMALCDVYELIGG